MYKRILFPVDVQEPEFAKTAFKNAVDFASHYGADLHVMTVVPGFGMPLVASYFPADFEEKSKQHALEQLEAFVKETVPVDLNVTTSVAMGRPYEEIIGEAEKIGADLIVIQSHNRKGLHGVLLGSCADNVVEHANCSVHVVR